MENPPTKKWLEKYEQIKNNLKPISKLDEYFTQNKICGKNMHLLDIGTVNFPTGEIIVCDPLVSLDRTITPYFTKVPQGIFPLTAAIVEVEQDHYRYAAVKVHFNENPADHLVMALQGDEDIEDIEEGDFFGFGVDAGLGTIVDIKTRDAYCDFIEKWKKENPEGNTYNDFFKEEFEKSYEKHPQFQREGGDWINFTIPGTELSIPMFQSGFGDGVYPVYFAYDKNNNICQMIIEFINIELEFVDE